MNNLLIGQGVSVPYRYLTRHMGIFGATGTGKTTTLGAVAERAPCPVLILDAKGDLESLSTSIMRPCMAVSAVGSELITRALNLTEAQSGALTIALSWAEDSGRTVNTLADLRNLLNDALRHDLSRDYGLISPVSVSAVQRAMLRLARRAPWAFDKDKHDPRDTSGRTVYACSDLTNETGLYGAFVCHVLDSLYRGLGEIGDAQAPALMVLIDEAHLIFDGASPEITRRIEQIVRLIRSKGVGLIFVTQAPSDLPHVISGQLATRIQHALRASTGYHLKALKAAAETMTGDIHINDILSLETGQAIVSVPDSRGRPLDGRTVKIQRGKIDLHPIDWQPIESVSQVSHFDAYCHADIDLTFATPVTADDTIFDWFKGRSFWWWCWFILIVSFISGFILNS